MPHVPDSHHPTHDLELIAAFAAGDVSAPERERASGLVAACADCATLHADLVLIAAALPSLPLPARPRDFRLSADDGARLHPRGLRGVLATLSGPRFGFAAPLGSAMAAIGIVAVLVAPAIAPAPRSATDASANAERRVTVSEQASGGVAGAASSAEESATASSMGMSAPQVAAPPAGTTAVDTAGGYAAPSVAPAPSSAAALTSPPDQPLVAQTASDQPLVPVGASVLLIGVGLIVVRVGARRLA